MRIKLDFDKDTHSLIIYLLCILQIEFLKKETMKKPRKKVFCAFIEFNQAFDKVWLYGLWQNFLL